MMRCDNNQVSWRVEEEFLMNPNSTAPSPDSAQINPDLDVLQRSSVDELDPLTSMSGLEPVLIAVPKATALTFLVPGASDAAPMIDSPEGADWNAADDDDDDDDDDEDRKSVV